VKRQIIKTRSNAPYRIARIVILFIIVAILVFSIATRYWLHTSPSRPVKQSIAPWKDLIVIPRNPQIPIDT